ncbi:hypothetical protein GDO78_018538 [Eleutherodactylus coqui]|uniref:Nuclear pore complex protein Nup153 n=2 Tax=Eleutherodactylus coqui TaxID=57060 RepID=A0A8J6BKB0_ELECQ|nr:hypothetical protein GDO78_018538 [Eleutherodactylus coqui]
MAAAGGGGGGGGPSGAGGKIRTRRYHLSSGRAPYSRSRQQGQQQGLISRVTDTVKSIVPAWLQKYFNKEEEVPNRTSNFHRIEDHVDDEQNEEQSQTYVQDDLPNTADGRITPEPVRTQEDQSTSRLTLNLSDVLTRPSLHRANLNFNILDSPALNCQPSTSSTYPIGTSSSFSLVKEIKDSTSQHDDDNISTTSGFSSRASDKDITVTKSLNPPHLWSPETDRPHVSHNSSVNNSRRPTFNLSTFGTLSPSLGHSSVLRSSQLGDSPFYPGKTTYGGAAAARTPRLRSTPYQVEASYPPVKKLVTPKSISVSTNASLYIKPSLTPSSTASASSRKPQGNNDFAFAFHSLSYPKFSTPASNGFPSGRGGGKIMRERGSHYTTKLPDEDVEAPDLPEISLPISTTALPKISFGLQTKTTPPPPSVFSTAQVTSSTSKNPEFTFSSPIVKSTESNAQSPGSSVTKTPVVNSSNVKKTEEEYNGFCKPAKTLKEGSVLDILKNPGFSASSSPQTTTTITPKSTSSPLSRSPAVFGESSKQALGLWYCSKCFIDNKASDNKCAACSAPKELPTGHLKESAAITPSSPVKNVTTLTSVQGFGEQFKKPPGTWDCETCLVQNKPESTRCIACETPKPGAEAKAALLLLPTSKSDKPTASADNSLTSGSLKFEELARKPIGSWECDVCLVQNKAEDNKCIACTTPKPGSSAPAITSTLPTLAQNPLGLLDQFKKAAGTWDCDVCLVNNKAEVVKCVACQSAKPGSKVELAGFGTSSGSSESTLPTIKFGLPPSSGSTDSLTSTPGGFSFPAFTGEIKFGISSSSKSTDENKDAGFKFGTSSSGSNSSSTSNVVFGFGKPAEKDATFKPLSGGNPFASAPGAPASASKPETSEGLSSNEKSNLTVSFGFKEPEGEKKNETPVASGFLFGKAEQKETNPPFVFRKKDEKSETIATATSVFGSKNEGEQPKPFVFGKPEVAKADAPTAVSFSFGVPSATEKKDTDQAKKPVFSFGLPAPTIGAAKPFEFGFPSNGSSPAPQPSSIGGSGSAFGSVQQPSTQTSTSGIFGSAVQSSSTSGTSGFGSTAPASASASTGFSTSAALSAPAASSSLLGSTTTLNTSSSSTIFGSAAPSIAASSASSVFGSAAPVNTTSASSVFGAGASTNTSASSSSLFGSSGASTTSSAAPFVFGQPATTASNTLFGNPNDSKSNFVFAGSESQPAVTSTGAAPPSATPFVFGAGAPSTAPAAPNFNFTGANTANVTAPGSTPFIFGAVAAPAAAASPVPAFGKPASQTNAPPAFGSSASTSLFPGASQNVPAFGSMTSNVQTPVFGQQSSQPAFGSAAAPASGSGFQFGNSNFNFASGSAPGVFQFGANPSSAPAQPANSAFGFTQPPTFNMG